jgi:hypothetical protein
VLTFANYFVWLFPFLFYRHDSFRLSDIVWLPWSNQVLALDRENKLETHLTWSVLTVHFEEILLNYMALLLIKVVCDHRYKLMVLYQK